MLWFASGNGRRCGVAVGTISWPFLRSILTDESWPGHELSFTVNPGNRRGGGEEPAKRGIHLCRRQTPPGFPTGSRRLSVRSLSLPTRRRSGPSSPQGQDQQLLARGGAGGPLHPGQVLLAHQAGPGEEGRAAPGSGLPDSPAPSNVDLQARMVVGQGGSFSATTCCGSGASTAAAAASSKTIREAAARSWSKDPEHHILLVCAGVYFTRSFRISLATLPMPVSASFALVLSSIDIIY